VHRAGDGLTKNLSLEDADRQEIGDANRRLIDTIFGETEPQESNEALNVEREESDRDDENEEEHGREKKLTSQRVS
jgi:hypothetical protein